MSKELSELVIVLNPKETFHTHTYTLARGLCSNCLTPLCLLLRPGSLAEALWLSQNTKRNAVYFYRASLSKPLSSKLFFFSFLHYLSFHSVSERGVSPFFPLRSSLPPAHIPFHSPHALSNNHIPSPPCYSGITRVFTVVFIWLFLSRVLLFRHFLFRVLSLTPWR